MANENIVPVTQELYNQLLSEKNELQADMKAIKDNVITLLKEIGMMSENGEMREGIKITSLLSIITGLTGNSTKTKEKFAFLGECLPLISKYKNL